MTEPLTVLLAEDDELVRSLVRASLRRAPVKLIEASTGPEALSLAQRERPSALVLDVGLPGLDGYAVCRAVRADPACRDVRVVMLTARAQNKDRDRGLAAGADAYLTKPFSPLDFAAELQRLLNW